MHPWLYAGDDVNPAKKECGDRYLLTMMCRTEEGCDDPSCGGDADPFTELLACLEAVPD